MYLTRVSARSGTTLTMQFRVTVPHLHVLLTAGGLSFDGTSWVFMPKGYIFPKAHLFEVMKKMETCYWNLDDRLVTAERFQSGSASTLKRSSCASGSVPLAERAEQASLLPAKGTASGASARRHGHVASPAVRRYVTITQIAADQRPVSRKAWLAVTSCTLAPLAAMRTVIGRAHRARSACHPPWTRVHGGVVQRVSPVALLSRYDPIACGPM